MSHRRPASLLFGLAAVAALTGTRPAHAQDTKACIDASESAIARKKADKLIDARKELALCASSNCPEVIKSSCAQRLAEMNRAIPTLTVFARDPAGNDLSGVKLSIDGVPFADRLDGRAIELDPGEHELRFDAAGQPPVVKRLVLHQGERDRRETVILGAPRTAPATPHVDSPPPFAAGPSEPTAPPPEPPEPTPSSGGSAQGTLAVIVGGAGVAALATGAVLGGLSLARHSSYEKNCGASIGAPSNLCNASGVSGEASAANLGTLSTGFFVGGGVAAVAGAVLFLLAPKSAASSTASSWLGVDVGPGSVMLRGAF